ncbi:hypothetical protein FQA39_LY19232 [Lamprigera yunnana]|nr:hypothetical protein FQA39_LY19232 [Lamprigera yunnana]
MNIKDKQSAGEEVANDNEDYCVNEVAEIRNTHPGFEQCDENDVSWWLAVDNDDPGYQIFNDQEIASMVFEGDAKTVESDSRYFDVIA